MQALVRNAARENSSLKHRTFLVTLALASASLLTVANAQDAATSKPEQAATSATFKVINIWPGVAPGSEQWKQPETMLDPDRIINVTTPTPTAYLPDPSVLLVAGSERPNEADQVIRQNVSVISNSQYALK